MMSARQITLLFPLALALIGAALSLQVSRYGAFLILSVAIASIGALALNLLNGLCGQISFSTAALLGVGAYTAGNLGNAGYGVFGIIAATLLGAVIGVLFGLPGLRLRGLYFGISTIATQFLFEYIVKIADPITNGVSGLPIKPLAALGIVFSKDTHFAALSLVALGLVYVAVAAIRRSDLGRAFLVVRESETVARGMGLNVARIKVYAFAISGAIAGLAGALMGFSQRLASPETFNLPLSIDYVDMIIVGGLGSLPGSLLGAAFVTVLPEAIQRIGEALNITDVLSALRELVFGLLMVVFLVFEPRGLSGLAWPSALRTKPVKPSAEASASKRESINSETRT